MEDKLYLWLLLSLSFNVIILFCLFQPNIVRLLHSKYLDWKEEENIEVIEEEFNTNSSIGSSHWFNTLIGQCIRMAEYVENHPQDHSINTKYGSKIKKTLQYIIKHYKKINK